MRLLILLTLALVSIPHARASTGYTFIKADAQKKITYRNPVWSPSGYSIAYTAVHDSDKIAGGIWNVPRDLWLATLKNGHWSHRLLVKGADGSAWSNDGKELAISRKGLAVLDLSIGKVRQLTSDYIPGVSGSDEGRIHIDFPISFSPNGRYLAYERELYESSEYRVFDLAKGKDSGVRLGMHPVWSADGKRIYSAYKWYADWPVKTRLVRTSIETGKTETVLKGYRIDWLALPGSDYAWALVDHPQPPTPPDSMDYPKDEFEPPAGRGIYRLNLTTRKLTKLLGVKEGEVIHLSPDLKRFAFFSKPAELSQPATLYAGMTSDWRYGTAATDAAQPWMIQTIPASWSADGKSLAYVTNAGDIRVVKPD